jgi:hypothetical protein
MTTARDDELPAPMATLTLRAGRLYFTRCVHERHFSGLTSVILLRCHVDLLILPVRHAAAGGYVIKIRNAHGDRLVEAMPFFQANGMLDDGPTDYQAAWEGERAALVVANMFTQQT